MSFQNGVRSRGYQVISTAFLILILLSATGLPRSQAQSSDRNQALLLARTLFKQGKFGEAAATYRDILEEDRSSAPTYAGLVQSYLKEDEVTAADEASRQALAALPQSGLIHASRGDVCFRKGRLAEAENEYRTALKLDESSSRALLGMGRIHDAVADGQPAKEYFARAHELDPDDGDALFYWAVLLPYPQSVKELEKHLSEYHARAEDERREREFIELLRGIGDREIWIAPKDITETEVKLEPIAPRAGTVLGLGLRVRLNHAANVTLLLDTGTSWMTISRSLAEKIGAKKISDYAIEGVGDSGPAGGYFAWVDKISVGNIEFRDCVVHVAIKNNPAGLDGVAGINIFAKYLLTIDFPRRKLTLARPPTSPGNNNNNDRESPKVVENRVGDAYRFGHIFLLNTLVNSASGLFVLDSGANTSSISPQLAQQGGKLREAGTRISGSSGEVTRVSLLPDAAIQFSTVPETKLDLTAFESRSLSRRLGTEVSGFIGFDVLNRMKLRINYEHGKVAVEQSH